MAGQRLALLIANAAYEHPELKKLVAPQDDVLALEILLTRPDIGSYRVQVVINATTATMQRTIGRVLSKGKREDTIVLFFAGHGLKHANGKLYFAGIDTDPDNLGGTALSASWLMEEIQNSYVGRQIVLAANAGDEQALQASRKIFSP